MSENPGRRPRQEAHPAGTFWWRVILLFGPLTLAILVAILLFFGFLFLNFHRFQDGIDTRYTLESLQGDLAAYEEKHGEYPKHLAEATESRFDAYGNPIAYRRHGAGYLLVSYGADGLPDQARYEPRGPGESSVVGCNEDQVFSHLGAQRYCSK